MVRDRIAYVLLGRSLRLIDLADPQNPVWRGRIDREFQFGNFAITGVLGGGFVYVSRADRVLEIIDVRDLMSLHVASRLELPGALARSRPFHAEQIAVDESYAYMVCRSNPVLVIVDVRDPEAPRFVGSHPLSYSGQAVTLGGDFVYVMDSLGLLTVIPRLPAIPPTLRVTGAEGQSFSIEAASSLEES